jgi:hypothetical protein
MLWRGCVSLLLASLIALSWTGFADQEAQSATTTTLKRALATYAIARGLNGVISVAQGTEIAIAPVGIGLTITVGEILDPLNDLVERFSWLVLVACASLATQLLLSELLANVWVSAIMTFSLVVYLTTLWWPPAYAMRTAALRTCTVLVFARFVFAAVTLVSGWIDQGLLAERQEAAVAQITLTRDHLQDLQTQPSSDTDASVLQRLGDFIDEQRQALDIESRLENLANAVEEAIEDLVRLMVLFLVQTIIIPITGLTIAYAGCKWLWRSGPSGPSRIHQPRSNAAI